MTSRRFLQDPDFITALYIVAFCAVRLGIAGLTGPRTAVRGNRIAAVGMAIAVVATLLYRAIGDWGLIALGVAIGTAVGVPAARNVKMTAMPQMVALFNGVGGGAVALIAWSEFRTTDGDLTDARVRDPARLRGDRRVDLVLGLEHRVRQAPGADQRPAGEDPRRRLPQPRAARHRGRLRHRDRSPASTPSCSSSRSSSARRCSATRSCCRSAARTCRS